MCIIQAIPSSTVLGQQLCLFGIQLQPPRPSHAVRVPSGFQGGPVLPRLPSKTRLVSLGYPEQFPNTSSFIMAADPAADREMCIGMQGFIYRATFLVDGWQSMGGFINGGTTKWIVYRENLAKIDDLGVPPFQDTSIW